MKCRLAPFLFKPLVVAPVVAEPQDEKHDPDQGAVDDDGDGKGKHARAGGGA
jgi:hypothetical protein